MMKPEKKIFEPRKYDKSDSDGFGFRKRTTGVWIHAEGGLYLK